MFTEGDTARRDWILLVMGLLAGGWFFLDYGNHHPLSAADGTLGEQAVREMGQERLERLGFSSPTSSVQVSFFSTGDPVVNRSTSVKSESDKSRPEAGHSFLWRMDVVHPEDAVRGELSFGGGNLDESISLSLTFSQSGEWMELRNFGYDYPQRLLDEEALSRVVELPEQLLLEARNDSVAKATFLFFDERRTVRPNQGRVHLEMRKAEEMAMHYLEQTGWPAQELQVVSTDLLTLDDRLTAARLNYRLPQKQGVAPLYLNVVLAPAGALLSLTAEYPGQVSEASQEPAFTPSFRALLLVGFCFWIFALLYTRLRSRTTDFHSGISLASFAAVTVPLVIVLRWIHHQSYLPGSPEAIDILLLLFSIGFAAVLSFLIFFVLTVTGESVTRQHRVEKIRTVDLIRMGQLYNQPVGTVFIHSFSFSLMLAGFWSLIFWFLPQSQLSVDPLFISDTTYMAPVTHLLISFFLSLVTIQMIHLVVIGQVGSRTKSRWLILLLSAAAFAFFVPIPVDIQPVGSEMSLNALTGAALGMIYVRRDFLATFLTYFLFVLYLTTAGGWLPDGSPDFAVFVMAAGLVLMVPIFGFIAVSRGRPVRDLPIYTPEYEEDLAREERIRQELQIARKVQQSFLPDEYPAIEGMDIAAACIPAYETGGDYYDFLTVGKDKVGILIGDVSGKGFEAAFYMTFIKGVLHAVCRDDTSTVTILEKANRFFRKNSRRGTFISMIFGIFDVREREFIFSRAGHNPLLYYNRQENHLKALRPPGLALGMTGTRFGSYLREQRIRLDEGDVIVLFTDGIVEATNRKGEFYEDHRLHRMIYYHQSKSADEILRQILKDVKDFSGRKNQHDDMTLIVIKA